MSLAEHSPAILNIPASTQRASPKLMKTEIAVLIVGVAAVATLAICRLIYEPSFQEKEQAAWLAVAGEHMKVCDQLGKPAGAPDRANCLKLLDQLNITHKQAFVADTSDI